MRNAYTMEGPLEPHFGDKKQTCLMSYRPTTQKMKHLNHPFQNCKRFRNRLNRSREIATRTWPKINTFMRFFLLPTVSRFWRRFWSKCQILSRVNFEVAIYLAVSEIFQKDHFMLWSRRWYRWRERNLQPTRSCWWRHFRWGCRNLPGIYLYKLVVC